MVDIYSSGPQATPDQPDDLRRAAELLFYAYRDFTAEPDRLLSQYGFGRAHHRVLHFVGRNPGITVAGLLGILRITKQSLSRVLRQLVDREFIERRRHDDDRRHRHLHLTAAGEGLETALSAPQQDRIAKAFAAAGDDAVTAYRSVLLGLVDEADRAHVAQTTGGD
jgi:DNA-binding MarR family transcriptional regulator